MTMNPMSSPSSVSRMRYRSRWNLATLAIGIALLIGGSFYYQAPDWDIPISLIMAGFACQLARIAVPVLGLRAGVVGEPVAPGLVGMRFKLRIHSLSPWAGGVSGGNARAQDLLKHFWEIQ